MRIHTSTSALQAAQHLLFVIKMIWTRMLQLLKDAQSPKPKLYFKLIFRKSKNQINLCGEQSIRYSISYCLPVHPEPNLQTLESNPI